MEFGTPPPEKRRQRSPKWVDRIAAMKSNPGQWALVGEYSPGLATHLRQGKYPSFIPDGVADSDEARRRYMSDHWEITTRKKNDGKRCDLWIRWVGGNG